MKSIKTVGVAVLAALALTAMVGVSSASALSLIGSPETGVRAHANSYPANIHGEQLGLAAGGGLKVAPKSLVIGMAGGVQLKCDTVTFSDPSFAPEGILGDTELLWLDPTMSGCALAGGKVAVSQDPTCLDTFNVGGAYEGNWDMCGMVIDWNANCKITFPSQMSPGVTFANSSWKDSKELVEESGIKATVKLTGRQYTVQGALCPNKEKLTAGTHTDGTVTGSIGFTEI
ncbi:MAG TPA: hypothetical protein VMR96_08390 [Solirubrobacterales bacterium]|nr:hypothetical protein [Solirubrobacterales bacterium]